MEKYKQALIKIEQLQLQHTEAYNAYITAAKAAYTFHAISSTIAALLVIAFGVYLAKRHAVNKAKGFMRLVDDNTVANTLVILSCIFLFYFGYWWFFYKVWIFVLYGYDVYISYLIVEQFKFDDMSPISGIVTENMKDGLK